MRRFVIVGETALPTGRFRLDDLPGTSGRLDVLLRCVRAAMLVSHGLRRDVVVYLVLGGAPATARVIRWDGGRVRFLRPDERSLATLAQKVLLAPIAAEREFVDARPGIAIASGGLERVIADLGPVAAFVLDETGADLRTAPALGDPRAAFFVGGHLGMSAAARTALASLGAASIAVGPVRVHADDAVAIVSNELDRRDAIASASPGDPVSPPPRGT